MSINTEVPTPLVTDFEVIVGRLVDEDTAVLVLADLLDALMDMD
jgi:hypothetical protein